ncbi:kelch repeat-containing protein [Scleropages formosus]|uniref:kelch repeat-containing protein n=1 Tax=Scleropages formosus TaxID=113540 RepID=UPI0010FA92EA|nr:rab9 effector protein with kelch motifs-like [Scleropages formosus]
MDDFSVYALLGVSDPPRRLLSAGGKRQGSVAVAPHIHQVVVFAHGAWRRRRDVTVELSATDGQPVAVGALTPHHKCLLWDRWEGEVGKEGSTLTVTLEGDGPDGEDGMRSKIECTPTNSTAAPLVRDPPRKRKRGQEDARDGRAGERENVCPNGSVSDTAAATPHRKVRGKARGRQACLFAQSEEHTSASAPQTHKAKGKQCRAPAQTASLVIPSGRWGQTLCPIDPQTAILIGGQGSRMQFCRDPMWKLCAEDMSWVPAETLAGGPTPEARIGHTATFDPESKRIYVFGGSKNKKWFNDVHILDTQSWRWTMVEAQGKVPPLAYHSCSLFRGELFVLGGVFPRPHPEPDGCSDALYIFNPEMAIWYQPIVNGHRPAPRSGHSACVLQGKIFVFGGWDTPVCFNDMHALDLGLMEFLAVNTSGPSPSPRSWHGCAVLSESKFLVHGGYSGNAALNDTFVFNAETSCWSAVVNTQLSAAPRAGHSIITMAKPSKQGSAVDEEQEGPEQTLLVFGGGDNEGGFFSDLTTVAIDELLH